MSLYLCASVYQQLMVDCDLKIETMLRAFQPRTDPAERPLPSDRKRNRAGKKRRKKNGHPNPGVDLRTEAYKLFGVDVTQIPGLAQVSGLSPLVAQQVQKTA